MQEIKETRVWFLGQENPLEEEMATHSSILAWKILGMEEPGGLKSTGLQRLGHDWACMHKLKPQRKSHTELCNTLCSETCFFSLNQDIGKNYHRSSGPTSRDSGSLGWQWWPWMRIWQTSCMILIPMVHGLQVNLCPWNNHSSIYSISNHGISLCIWPWLSLEFSREHNTVLALQGAVSGLLPVRLVITNCGLNWLWAWAVGSGKPNPGTSSFWLCDLGKGT